MRKYIAAGIGLLLSVSAWASTAQLSAIGVSSADAEVTPGEWHGGYAKCLAKAKSEHRPLLSVYSRGDGKCSYCNYFANAVASGDFKKWQSFFGQGMIYLYMDGDPSGSVGNGYPVFSDGCNWAMGAGLDGVLDTFSFVSLYWERGDGTVVDVRISSNRLGGTDADALVNGLISFIQKNIPDFFEESAFYESQISYEDPFQASGFGRYSMLLHPGDASGQAKVTQLISGVDSYAPPCPYKRDGYVFDGWRAYYSGSLNYSDSFEYLGVYIGGGCATYQVGDKIDFCGISALVATWKEAYTVDVAFDANGGNCPVAKGRYEVGEAYGSLPTPLRKGYHFEGWYTALNGGSQVDADTPVDYTERLYAHWSKFQYSVTLYADPDNTSTKYGTIDCCYGEKVGELPVPFRDGYTFLGWYTASWSETQGNARGICIDDETVVTCNMPVYAHWVSEYASTVRVSFNANGGSVSPSSIEYACGSTYGYLPEPTRNGYSFAGWYTSSSGGSEVDVGSYVPYSDITLYATWRKLQGITVRNDWLSIGTAGDQVFEVGDKVSAGIADYVTVDSGSAATISVSGLPTGLKYDSKKRRISGKTTKRGVYYVKFSAKNANGYSMSDTCIWNVGYAGNGDYDKIGLYDMCDLDELDDLRVGDYFSGCGYNVTSVSGLPSGLKWTKGSVCSVSSGGMSATYFGEIRGTPTKAGKFVITFTKGKLKTRKTVIVRDVPCKYLTVAIGDGYSGRGTVSGGGLKRPGATVKLSAKPAKNRYFAGWYADATCETPFLDGNSGDYRKADESFVFESDGVTKLYAKFLTKDEDYDVWIDADSEWDVDTEYADDSTWITVYSETKPSITTKGLPAGLKLTREYSEEDGVAYFSIYVSDKTKLKPGYYTAKLTAKNLSGATDVQWITIVIPNIRSDVFTNLKYDTAYEYDVGESFACRDPSFCSYESGWTIKASGLPDGMKFNAGSGYCSFSGVASKAGTYTVTLTATKGKQVEKATFTVKTIAFPSAFTGSFGGSVGYGIDYSEDDEDDYDEWDDEFGYYDSTESTIGHSIYDLVGTFTMSISSAGKISVKFNAEGKSVSLSGYSCSVDENNLTVSLSSGSNSCSLNITPTDDTFGCQVSGSVSTSCGTWQVRCQKNVAKSDERVKTMVSRLKKLGQIKGIASGNCICCPICTADKNSKVYFTVDASGTVKASGTIAGRKLSGSAQLRAVTLQRNGEECDEYYYDEEYEWEVARRRAGYYILYADFCDMSKSTPLIYRVYFDETLVSNPYYHPTANNALYGGAYRLVDDGVVAPAKPVIYLYPETETACSVQLTLNGRLTCTYPDYGLNGWRDFIAAPDGTLTFADGKQYYCLYWEGEMDSPCDFSRGYCVKGSETGDFLAEVLPEMGLNFREANEFIIYWLPLMQDNPYNVIAFQGDCYDRYAKLEIEPKPDSLLRVFMAWKPSERALDIEAPVIKPFERKGFTVVEWGGSKVSE